jgi:hypothetical protein
VRRVLALLALLALGGCVTVASIHVDGERGRTYVVPFGGVAIERAPSDAVGVRETVIGLFGGDGSYGLGVATRTFLKADSASCGVAILGGAPRAPVTFTSLERLSDRTREECLRFKEIPNEVPLRSAGGDR